MRRSLLLGAGALLVWASTHQAIAGPTVAAPGATPSAAAAPAGLPADAPAALYRPEPGLPVPRGWTNGEAFPRTSGYGRLSGGAQFWTDYLYDDHGATGKPTPTADLAGSPSFGTYVYPDGAAHGNGADIFRAAVRLTPTETVWRVDFTTLADPRIPIAAWTLDRDANPATGVASWGSNSGLTSPGIDTAVVMSAQGTRVVDLLSGTDVAHLATTVDTAAHAFVVHVPRSVLAVAGHSTLRLAAGLADAAGTGFAAATGALPGEANAYNVAFRTPAQEPPSNNYWNDTAQARALVTGDVSAFALPVSWADLAAGRATPEPQPTGWSDRWYVSSVDLGPGVITDPATVTGGAPNFLGRVQPYAVYVPTGYRADHPAPLTFLLHSLTQNHNQYAATTPRFVDQSCQQRVSICVTTLGRGPDGSYYGTAQLDFFEVWNRVAGTYRLDPERTVSSGYSMGGIGTNTLAMAHPDLFAAAVTLAGGVGAAPQLENLREVPTYLAGGLLDELVPVTKEKDEADALDALGYRYRWLLYPAEDHVALELQDGFSDAAAYMGTSRRSTHPARVTYRWSPTDVPGANTQQPALGLGTTGAYWLRGLTARSAAADARVDATSGRLADPVITPVRSRTAAVPGDPTPAVVTSLTWQSGGAPAPVARLALTLSNVSALRVLLADAGFPAGSPGLLVVTSDGPATLQLGGTRVSVPAGTTTVAFTA